MITQDKILTFLIVRTSTGKSIYDKILQPDELLFKGTVFGMAIYFYYS